MSLSLLLMCVAMASATPASPAEAQAEHTRLVQEMDRLAARNQWTGVDRDYRLMVAIEGARLSYDDHWRGAQASEALGHPTDTWHRLQAAIALDPRDDAYTWKAQLMATYGEVNLSVGRGWKSDVTLQIEEMPFDPQSRNAIEAAREALQNEHSFVGLLPLGQYTFCGYGFEVIGGPSVQVKIK